MQIHSILLLLLLMCQIVNSTLLTCHDCYKDDTGEKECSKESTCRGVACVTYTRADNDSFSSFCLLAWRGEEKTMGCWTDKDMGGRHCMCNTDFCNVAHIDPALPTPAYLVKLTANPLIDSMDEEEETGSVPLPQNVFFPDANFVDPRVAGSDDEDDNLPYEGDKSSSDEKRLQTMSSQRPPSLMMMLLPMAATFFRFFFILF